MELQLRYLNKEDIVKLNISIEDTNEIVEQTYIAHSLNCVYLPAKVGIYPKDSTNFFHSMPSMIEGFNNSLNGAGIKWVSYFPGNSSKNNVSDSSCIMILNDVDTGLPYAIMEGMHLTYMRTAASGAIAAKKLANPNSAVLGVIGAGEIARWTVHAITSIMPSINEILVTSRTGQSRTKFCSEMSKLHKDITFTPYSDLQTLVSKSDIALSITSNMADPFINFDWLKDGSLALSLDGIQSWDLSFENASCIITDDKEYLKSEIERKYNRVNHNDEMYEISDLIKTNKIQWSNNRKNIAFMSGIGSTDVAMAKYIYEQAVKRNIGTVLSL